MKIKIKKRGAFFVVDYEENGKRTRNRFGTKREAEAFQSEKIQSLVIVEIAPVAAVSAVPEVSLFDALVDYREFRKPDFEHRCYLKFRSLLREIHSAFDAVGVKNMSQINNETMERVIRRWRAKYSNSTTNRQIVTLKPFLERAHRLGHLPQEVHLKRLGADSVSREPWKPSEDFLEKVVPHVLAPLKFIGLTGCRPIEVCNLQIRDLVRGGALLKSKKGNRSNERWLPLAGGLAPLVSEAIRGREHLPDALVFVNQHGRRILPVRISDEVRRVRRLMGMPEGIVPYGQRHHMITALLEAGVPIHDVQAIAGHKRMSTTQGYAHSKDEGVRRGLLVLQGAG